VTRQYTVDLRKREILGTSLHLRGSARHSTYTAKQQTYRRTNGDGQIPGIQEHKFKQWSRLVMDTIMIEHIMGGMLDDDLIEGTLIE